MKRLFALAACGLSLAGCSSMPGWMQLNTTSAPAATTMQFESEPAGAEARISDGQTCRTPCSLPVSSSEFTVSFTLGGYQPQTVPVKVVPDADPTVPPRLVPNPVFVELQSGAPAPAARRQPPPRQQKPKPAPRQPPTAMAPAPPPAPAPAPASPWPPAR